MSAPRCCAANSYSFCLMRSRRAVRKKKPIITSSKTRSTKRSMICRNAGSPPRSSNRVEAMDAASVARIRAPCGLRARAGALLRHAQALDAPLCFLICGVEPVGFAPLGLGVGLVAEQPQRVAQHHVGVRIARLARQGALGPAHG